ncbi:MAG: hypothetical protein KME06_15710 [Kastovskya adunca ATA6-11-RM4]|nr:hypothetical protein [Kastovskya adunca ATA6-11-RM4]
MAPQHNYNKFPLWQFLTQPVFDSTTKLILNPRRFWGRHNIRLLERCWAKECSSKGRYRS